MSFSDIHTIMTFYVKKMSILHRSTTMVLISLKKLAWLTSFPRDDSVVKLWVLWLGFKVLLCSTGTHVIYYPIMFATHLSLLCIDTCNFEKRRHRCKAFMWIAVPDTLPTGQLVKLKVMAVVFFIPTPVESIRQHCAWMYISGGCEMRPLRQFKRKNKAKLIWGSGRRSIKLPPLFAFLYQKLEPSAWMERILCTHIWRKAAKHTREGGRKKDCFVHFPLPLPLFPTLPKVLLGNRSQVFDKPVVDMTAVQSSV